MHSPLSSRHARLFALAAPVAVAVAACASPPLADPAAAPRGDPLLVFLRTSPAVRAVADAARARGLLSEAEPDLGELELATRSLGIDDLGELESRVEGVLGDVPALFATLDRRSDGGKRGDVAHWVSVALVGLDGRPLRQGALRAGGGWEERYLDEVLELRRLHQERALEPPAGALEADPPAGQGGGGAAAPSRQGDTPGVTLALPFEPGRGPEVVAARDTPAWPVFTFPGSRQVVATVRLERGRTLPWDELRVRVRRPGGVGIGEPLDAARRFRLAADGRMVPDGEATLEAGRRLDLLVDLDPGGGYALLGPGRVVELPRGCCPVVERAETDWWVRLSGGDGDGGWVLASSSAFRMRHSGLEEPMRQRPEVGARRRLGGLGGTGTLEVAGAELIHWLAGNEDAPPLFVLHGGPGLGSRYLQNPLLRTLGQERLLVFYDQRGSGYSEGAGDPATLTLERFVRDLDAVRRAAGRERIDLLGHSFGGLLALHYVLEFPERVGKLVLVDPDPASRELWEASVRRLTGRTAAPDAARLAEIEARPGWERDPAAMTEWLRTRMRAYVVRPEDVEELEIGFDEATLPGFRVTSEAVRADLGDWDLHERLGAVTAPALIVAGGDSIFPRSAMEALEEALPDARLRFLEGVGHFPFVEDPEGFAAAVLDFLEGR